MKFDEPLWVVDCPLCDIFINKSIRTKLYWPINPDDIKTSDFIIIECETCKVPMIVYRDHTTTISREDWGRILFKCKKLFGNNVNLRLRSRTVLDHWHAHINVNNRYSIDEKV